MSVLTALLFVLAGLFGLSACEERPALEEAVDFVLEVEAGRDVKILQLTDIQIIDSSQMRTPDRCSPGRSKTGNPKISPISPGNTRGRR